MLLRAIRSSRPVMGLVAFLGAAAIVLTACGSNNQTDDTYRPTSYGPVIAGQPSCAYWETRDECKDSGIDPANWFQMPREQPANYRENDTSDTLSQLFLFHLIYSSWFSSPGYVNTYVPASNRNTYTSTINNYDKSYGSRAKSYASKAQYRNTSGKVVTGDKVDPKKLGTTAKNGGDRGKSGCRSAGVSGNHPTSVQFASYPESVALKPRPPKPNSGGGFSKPKPKPAQPGTSNNRNNGNTSQKGC